MKYLKIAALTSAVLLSAAPPAPLKSGIDIAAFDPSCKPCDDFWRHVNGTFLDKNPIPARFPSWGVSAIVREGNKERLRVILESAAANRNAPASSNEQKIGDFFASCIDTAAIESAGLKPIEAQLKKIAAIATTKELVSAIIEFQGQGRSIAPMVIAGSPDLKNSKMVIANIFGVGLSLPDRDYYFKDDARSVEIRDEFKKHVGKMFELLGDSASTTTASAQAVLNFETALADATLTNVQRRDPNSRYHKMNMDGLAALSPSFDWQSFFKVQNVATNAEVNVTEPAYVQRLEKHLKNTPIADWKTWLRWRLLTLSAPNLSKKFADEDFYFSKTVLTGVKEQLPRWQDCTAIIDGTLGDALGELFVKKHFPAEAKKRMNDLVETMREALREQLNQADWLTPETRKNAVAKLNSFVAKIGYADRWRNYSAVKVDRKSYFQNVLATVQNNRQYQLSKIGKLVDKNDWGMTPPTLNAYYSPLQNEIAFPAGILQPPFFDMTADDAVNFGAIGAIIGHEMGHGFDDQGSKFDAEGNLKNWWTVDDRQKFEARANCVINQFNNLDVGDGLRHTGKLVVGEALGDLGGLKLAYNAYRRTLRGKPEPPVMDGYTADQRFFIAFAHIWATQTRSESVRLLLNTNPHPLAKFRANGTLMNMPEFHRAFQCKPGDAMVRPVDEQCKLW